MIEAFNDDMPYDLFVKAQIAGDHTGKNGKLNPGLGFYALSPESRMTVWMPPRAAFSG